MIMYTRDHSLINDKTLLDLFLLKSEYGKVVFDKTWSSDTERDPLDPVVSRRMVSGQREMPYPEDRQFAVCLTHDIDDIYPPLSHTLLSLMQGMRSMDYGSLYERLISANRGRRSSPYRNFKDMMDLEESYGARSSFYFMTAGADHRRFRYHIEDVGEDLGEIADRGWEVGLHGGYFSYDSVKDIVEEKRRLESVLGKKVIGYRNHYLRFKVPDTWEHLAEAGIKYDTTIGYSDTIGFRNGMCHPFTPYNMDESRTIDIVEIPLEIMDSALFKSTRSFGEALDRSKRLIDTVEGLNGVVTLLWHNNSMVHSSHRARWAKLYEKLLQYCKDKNAWMTTGEEIYKCYKG